MSAVPHLLRFRPEPHGLFETIRAGGTRFDAEVGGWVVVSHAEVSSVLRRPQFGRTPAGAVAPATSSHSFLGIDPPDHTRLRGIVAETFHAANIQGLRDDMATRARGLVEQAVRTPRFDMVVDVAAPLAVASCSILGIPGADRALVREWASALTWLFEPRPAPAVLARANDAVREATAYFIDALHQPPASGLITTLRSAVVAGDCSLDEAAAMCLLLIMAGHETSVGLVGMAAAALLDAPQQAALLRDGRASRDSAVDELIRYTSPVQMLTRLAREDVDIGGVRVEAGSFVVAIIAAANRDPDVFEAPHELRLDRSNAARQLGFGAGIHYCLGAVLARLQAEAFLDVITEHLPRLAPADGVAFTEKALFRSFARLPVEVVTR